MSSQEPAFGERFVIVLNRTQDVVNIATSLRAMMNMGLTRLRLVRADDFSAYRIAGIAHGSEPLIERIEFFDTLDEATADAALVIGTTARRRTATYLWNHPREAAPGLLTYDAAPDRPVAIVFGREDTGLLNEELDRCDRLLVVPTSEINSSLNLAQAVLLIGYELMLAATPEERELPRPRRDTTAASALQMRALFEQSEAALAAIDFFKGKNPEAIMRTLRAVLRRAELTSREATLLRAMGIETQKAFGVRPLFDSIMRGDPVGSRGDPEAGMRDRDGDRVAGGTAGEGVEGTIEGDRGEEGEGSAK
jgi:tRNA/rRNA methyltransferase/tRNA (cytidine32/uridine32-2'-O)-methyltransferase